MTVRIQVTGIAQTIKQIESDLQKHIEMVADAVANEAPKYTPKRTGRAAGGWQKDVQENNFEVYNAVPYVKYLEQPYVKSKQAPRGIIMPTLTAVKRKLK